MEENTILTQEQDTDVDNSWKVKALVIGGLIGAVTGVGTAYLLSQRAEQKGERLSIGTGRGVKLGVLLIGLLRQVLSLGED
ncbi:MAG: hypothetical protein JXB85_10385 [Anaerolineales bacterium]|nr:hypothetical protein [Anaerolineales bacterium]